MSDKRILTKNQRRRLKKKLEKHQKHQQHLLNHSDIEETTSPESQKDSSVQVQVEVEVEYVSLDVKEEIAELSEKDPAYEEFVRIFGKFSSAEELCGQTDTEKDEHDTNHQSTSESEHNKPHGVQRDVEEKNVLKKQKKKLKRLTVAELKQLVSQPEVVEAHDVTSADPRFLVYLKSYRNTVPVPRHWCHKRKYLQGKRGIEKVAFLLPTFIAQTGIAEVRGIDTEDDAKKKIQTKTKRAASAENGSC